MRSFKINKYLTLKLEKGKTNIYINGRLFQQCKFLLLNILVEEVNSFDDIESIDEAEERLDRSLGQNLNVIEIPPKIEFWGHCSNLQVWFENNYNTQLIHRNLAFPLLHELSKVGDPIAEKIFIEEIARRFESGNSAVMNFLILEGYLKYLPQEYLEMLSKNGEFLKRIVRYIVEKPLFKNTLIEYINHLKNGDIQTHWIIKNIKLDIICKIYEEVYDSYTNEENETDFLDGIEIFLWEVLRKEIDKIFLIFNVSFIKDLFKIFDNNQDYGFILVNEFLNKNIIIPIIRRCLEIESLEENFLSELNDRLKSNERIYSLVNLLNCYIRFSGEKQLNYKIKDFIIKILSEDKLSEFSNFIRLRLLRYLKSEDLILLFKNNEINLLDKISLASNKKIPYENYNWTFNELKEYDYNEFLEWKYELFKILGEDFRD
ncbi:hypothetical protein LCGC14_0764480 [marine sediment metagenome]|uniref:Uncharacterized protein n=1 Tax=marine sediment metagenome TaxID=412755 RepID=A0A0F9QJZ3_9ZZZZ